MKNKVGVFGGFAFGMAGFLVMFKFLFLDRIPPSDELAPGVVVLVSIMNGILFAVFGLLIQNRIQKKRTTPGRGNGGQE